MESQVKDIIANLQQSNKVWQESKPIEPYLGNPRYQTTEARSKLFREICDYHAKDNKFIVKNDAVRDIVNNLFKYCNLQSGKYDITKGLYIHGSVGPGKSTLLKIVRDYSKVLFPRPTLNNLRPKRPDEMWMADEMRNYIGGFNLINTTQVCNSYKLEQKGENSLADYYSPQREVGFDEFGREPIPTMNYGTTLNVMQYVLEIRYDNWKNAKNQVEKLKARTHFSTNIITGKDKVDVTQLQEKYAPHIADRIQEMCNIIHLGGSSFRA